ncbi:MAG TPA: cytochrome o ubiquinol oxidase subunit IV [Patescibacteria group bacterium]
MQEQNSNTFKSYTLGFFLSIGLTLMAYFVVAQHLLIGWDLVLVIMGLAFIQLWVQLIFFLHLGQESKPRWNLYALFSTGSIIFIVIVGSLWIMQNLSYHMPTEAQIIHDEGIHK